jgi:hypothetical protein
LTDQESERLSRVTSILGLPAVPERLTGTGASRKAS